MTKFSKKKFYFQVAFNFFFSLAIYLEITFGNAGLDRFAAKYDKAVILLLLLITLCSVWLGSSFYRQMTQVQKQPEKMPALLQMMNIEVFLFSLIFFFMDALFDNPYLSLVPEELSKCNPFINGAMILGIVGVQYLRKRKTMKKKQAVFQMIFWAFIGLGMNYMEIIFLGGYVGMVMLISKIQEQRKKVTEIVGG